MQNCSFCPKLQKAFCTQCETSSCLGCMIAKHTSCPENTHEVKYLCQECEEESAAKFCENCDQYLCSECDTRIHNKGKRAQHSKKLLLEETCFDKINNFAYVTSAFLEEYLMNDASFEVIKSKVENLLQDADQALMEEQAQSKNFSLIILEKSLSSGKAYDLFLQTLAEFDLEGVVFSLISPFEVVETMPKRQLNISSCSKLEMLNLKRISLISSILQKVKAVEIVHLYDTYSNASLAKALMDESNKQIYLNFDLTNKQAFKSSIFLPQLVDEVPYRVLPMQHQSIINQNQTTPFNNSCKLSQYQDPIFKESDSDHHQMKFYGFPNMDQFHFGAKENIHPNTSSCFDNIKTSNFELINNKRPQIPILGSADSQLGTSKSLILTIQPMIQIALHGCLEAGTLLQYELMDFANSGDLLISRDVLINKIINVFDFNSAEQAEALLAEAERKKLVHVTIRKFLHNNPYYYIGMLLNTISIESLVWIIKSIRNDSMTPTEKLILSRLKECYGLKVDQNYWKSLQNFISINSDSNTHKGNHNLKVDSSCPLYIKSILDPVTNLETSAIYLTNEEWTPEDQGQIDDKSIEWKAFIEFIEDFFEDKSKAKKEKERMKLAGELIKGQRWSNSVENVMNKPHYDSNEKFLRITDDVKAIPGGRYGCAQFIKYCGPEVLRELSIGRLSLLVQEAINKNILRYQRTLLIKNSSNDENSSFSNKSDFETEVLHSLNTERKAKVLSMVKEALLEILMEHADGISLAQIPFHLKRKLKFPVDFQELGFPKLKNFLSTLKNLVVIQSAGTNHTYVKLKGPLSQHSNQTNTFHKNGYTKRRFGDIDNLSHGSNHFSRGNMPSFNFNPKPVEKMTEQRVLFSELKWIKDCIQIISKQNPNGISIQGLYQELCDQIKGEVAFRNYGCDNFYEFLIEHADSIVDIAARKDGYIIYPKAQSFWTKGKNLFSSYY